MDHNDRHRKKHGKSGNRQRFYPVSDQHDWQGKHRQHRKRVPYRRNQKQGRDFLPGRYTGSLQDWEDHEVQPADRETNQG